MQSKERNVCIHLAWVSNRIPPSYSAVHPSTAVFPHSKRGRRGREEGGKGIDSPIHFPYTTDKKKHLAECYGIVPAAAPISTSSSCHSNSLRYSSYTTGVA